MTFQLTKLQFPERKIEIILNQMHTRDVDNIVAPNVIYDINKIKNYYRNIQNDYWI